VESEEDIALLHFPHVVNPYLAHIAASTIQSRNLGVQAFARATQDGITTTSEHLAQQWETASAPSSIRDNLLQALHHVEDIPLPAQPTPGGSLGPQALTAPLLAARNFSTSSVGGGAGGEASTSTSVTGDYNTLTPEERAARKTEIAKEGWRKRRLNAQEKKESDSAKRQKGLEAAARKRESRRNAAEKLKAAKAQAQQQQMQEAQEALLAMQQLPPQQQQPISEADMTIPASMAEDVKPFEQAAILNGQGHPQQPSLNRDSDTLDFDSHLSRKRAVSASSSVNGSTVNTGKRARLSPSVDVKQETVEPSMQLPLPVSPALPLPSPFVQPQQALLPHMQASPSLPPPSVLEPPPQTSPALPAPITAKPDLASTAAAAAAAAARSKSDYERKVWATIARSSIPKVIRAQQQGLVSRQTFHKRLSGAAAREGKKYNTKNVKPLKDLQIKARRVMREMLLHLKGSEKSQKETKRKQDKEVLEKSRKEEEAREAQRAARKLNFLITQTELYSHFVGSKLKSEYEHRYARWNSALIAMHNSF
jgi:DNA helicase INO80